MLLIHSVLPINFSVIHSSEPLVRPLAHAQSDPSGKILETGVLLDFHRFLCTKQLPLDIISNLIDNSVNHGSSWEKFSFDHKLAEICLIMTHSQMLGKVEYGLPAKI